MTVDINKIISWYNNHIGKLTYSMYGSRTGDDGTADCSGAMTEAIYEAGGTKPDFIYSTMTLPAYLATNKFERISQNQDWQAQHGDVVLMSWGKSMAESGGAGGHVGVMKDGSNFISVDFWTSGQAGTAVSQHDWNAYYANSAPSYIEVWRYKGDSAKPSNPVDGMLIGKPDGAIGQFQIANNAFTAFKDFKIDEVKVVNGIEQAISYKLAGGKDFNWTDNGIPTAILSGNKVGQNVHFIPPYNEGTIDEYDKSSNGVCIDYEGYGTIWLDATALLEL